MTSRLSFRAPSAKDLAAVCDIFSRPEIVAHRPDPTPETIEDARKRLRRDMAHWDTHGFGRWAAIACDEVVGFGGLTVSEAYDGLNLSFHIHPGHWRKGYASELAAHAVRFGFGILKAERIIALVRPANPASAAIVIRAGLVFEKMVELGGAETRLFGKTGAEGWVPDLTLSVIPDEA